MDPNQTPLAKTVKYCHSKIWVCYSQTPFLCWNMPLESIPVNNGKGTTITAAIRSNDFCVTGPECRTLSSGCAFSIPRKHSAENCARTAEFESEKRVTRDSSRASATSLSDDTTFLCLKSAYFFKSLIQLVTRDI